MVSYSLENEFSTGDRGADLLGWCERIQLLCDLLGSGLDPVRFSEVAFIVRDYARAMQAVLKSGGPVLLSLFNRRGFSLVEFFKDECDRVCDPQNKGVLCLEIDASELLAKVESFRHDAKSKDVDKIIGKINEFLGPDWSK